MTRAEEYDRIARTAFLPIYRVIAKDILACTGIREGRVLDLGSGGGHLGLSVLKEEEGLLGILLDKNPDAAAIAEKRAEEWGLRRRAIPLVADVLDIPLPDESIDLAVSRGSFLFWPDAARAFSEILRVLAPGGKTYIGGGFGNGELKAEIVEKMKRINPGWPENVHRKSNRLTTEDYRRILEGLPVRFQIVSSEEKGFWIIMEKPG